MITLIFIFGILFIIVGVLLWINKVYEGFLIVVCGTLCTFPFIITKSNPEPTKQDVLDGKAYYQETQVITGNDTIKTYDIVWKQENF